MLAKEKLLEPRVDVDEWRHAGLPHIRLDFTVVDAESLHNSSVMRSGREKALAAAPAERTREGASTDEREEGVGVTDVSVQVSGRLGPGLYALLRVAGYWRAISKAAGGDGGRPLQEWRKLPTSALAR